MDDDVSRLCQLSDVPEWLNTIYIIVREDNHRKAADIVYDEMKWLELWKDFEFIDHVLQQVDECRLSTSLMRSFLSTTWGVRNHLTARDAFYDRVHTRMEALKGPQHTKRVLGSLA